MPTTTSAFIDTPVGHAAKKRRVRLMLVLLTLGCSLTVGRAQPTDNDSPGAHVLTRGPVHEAFAGIVTFDPAPGLEITQAPPDNIEEIPPEERPEGDTVTWIPGYWAWDDERSDFLWISGTWRALPPGRAWMAGYWGKTSHGYQWISGYWAEAKINETTYLPAPPATVEAGPNIAAPSEDYTWTPGCWLWYRGRYAWRPGYWTEGRADWDWIPANYVWTPRGYLFVDGYWDYPVERRGLLYAPVYFEAEIYSRRSYRYSPTIVINLAVFTDHLFLRPRYHHYYFGDYYAASYVTSGIYASYTFQSRSYGYDSFYSRQRWEHRRDRDWEQRVAANYENRRDHENSRPPRTWSDQRRNPSSLAESAPNRLEVAISIDQLAKRKGNNVRLQTVAQEERQTLTHRGQDVQKSREQRRLLEAQPAQLTPSSGQAIEPAKGQLPHSPIVAKPVDQLSSNQLPPKAPKAPKPDPKFPPHLETPNRQPKPARRNQATERHQSAAENPPAPSPVETTPHSRQNQPESRPPKTEAEVKVDKKSQQHPRDTEKKAPQATPQRTKDERSKADQESPRKAPEVKPPTPPETERPAKKANAIAADEAQRHMRENEKINQAKERQVHGARLKADQDSSRNAQAAKHQAQQESEQRARKAAAQDAAEAHRKARVVEMQAQQDSEQKTKAIRAQEESLRNQQQSEENKRKQPNKPDRKQPDVDEKDATNPPNDNHRKNAKKRHDDSSSP